MRRLLLSSSWVLRHLLAIFLIGLFVRLGWWQLVKGRSDHGTLQNLFYGIEWPIFAATVVFFWWKMVREELKPSGQPAPPTEPGTIAPVAVAPNMITLQGVRSAAPPASVGGGHADGGGTAAPDDAGSDDEELELAEYNRYLASLYESSARGASR